MPPSAHSDSSMPRVLHLISGLAMGGAENALLKLLGGAEELRAGAGVVSLRDRGALGPLIERLGVPVQAAGIMTSLPTPVAAWRVRRMVSEYEPELIHGWMYHANLAAVFAASPLRPRPPVLWNVQHSVYSLRSEKLITAGVIALCARLSGRVAGIIYNSRTAAAQHERLGYAADRTIIIPNGFDTERFRPSAVVGAEVRAELGIGAGTLVVGMIGRFHPMKDHTNFLRAGALLASKMPGVQLVLAGPGVTRENKELTALLERLQLGAEVSLLGERRDPERLLTAFDVLCLPSSSEGSPNVVGEAMAAGVPCVVTDVGDSAWLVGETGRVVPPRDPEALAAALAAVLQLPVAGRRGMGMRARDRVVQEFSLPMIAKRYADVQRGLAMV